MARKPKNTFDIPTIQDAVVAPAATEQASDNATYSRSRCGGALRQAREAQGLSVQDVASKLRLSPKQIEAIEADHFAKLPEPTIVRGFIRNYAKLLKINSEPLLDAYTVIVPSNIQHDLILKPATNMQVTSGDKPKTSSYIWAGLAALLALGAWLFYQSYIEKPSPTKPSVNLESSLEPLPEPALPAAERAPELQAATEITLPPAADVALPVAPVDLAVPATPSAAPVATLPVVAAPAMPVTTAEIMPEVLPVQAGLAKIELNANQETWVGIIDADGKQIYDKIIFAGSRETIEAKLPLNITVGNAGATSLSLNGKPVALAPHSRNNVARIKLE
jgi:cytoskeleton protein RodZ